MDTMKFIKCIDYFISNLKILPNAKHCTKSTLIENLCGEAFNSIQLSKLKLINY